jgi:heme/copper-type cytochrome/quinol oxidase subunit 1
MATRYLKIAVLYFIVGVSLGIWMGMSQKFQFVPVHAHINLLGWASMAIMGVIYHIFPDAAKTRLAAWQFWLYNIGVAAFVISLATVVSGHDAAVPAAIISANLVLLGVVLFAINVFVNVRESRAG